MKKKVWTVVFAASGMPTERTKYETHKAAVEAAKAEAEEIAGNFENAKVVNYGDDEWVVYDVDEIARWEIF